MWFTEAQLAEGILGLYAQRSIRHALRLLEDKGFISVHANPNPAYRFDRTKFFRFYPDAVNAWLKGYREGKPLDHPHPAKRPDRDDHCPEPSGEKAARAGENAGAIHEISLEITVREETTTGEATASPRSASSPAEAADAPAADPPPSAAQEERQKKPRKLPLRQQPGELHPDLVALIQSMSCNAFHALAEPNKLVERFWDAQIDLLKTVGGLGLRQIIRECDAWYMARPKKWPFTLDGAMRRMAYSVKFQLEQAQRRAVR